LFAHNFLPIFSFIFYTFFYLNYLSYFGLIFGGHYKGKKEHKKESNDVKYHRMESHYGSFERSLELPDNIDEDNINAKFKNGILEVSVNKKEKDSSVTKQIAINKE
jgi:hypothetical protein